MAVKLTWPGFRRTPLLAALCAATALTALTLTGAPVARGAGAGPTAPRARDSLRTALTDQNFYFVMQDRFANGTTANDAGGLTGSREVTGLDPTAKGWYHGGDLIGLRQELPYIKGLG